MNICIGVVSMRRERMRPYGRGVWIGGWTRGVRTRYRMAFGLGQDSRRRLGPNLLRRDDFNFVRTLALL